MQIAATVNTFDYPFDCTPITDVGGAEIGGVDLSKRIDPGVRDAIMQAFLEYHILDQL